MCARLVVLLGMLYMKLECIAMKFEHYKNFLYLGLLTPMMQGASGCWGSNFLAVSNAS